jgi:hypothetical protein
MSRAHTNGNPTESREESREEKIRARAQELFQKRGGQEGRAMDDWLQAEAEFLQQTNRVPAPRATTSRRKASN